ncbi:MgtC/SapB family protein [Paenibacillus sp. JMULE4]|uniref:MgtC/SapB family protein n=1 Tax=Paenibacillus TaxID=44249 RepID=UPI0015772595|nr:MgtC/SapB family protein [Paenibacillus sp. JMULE4]NTZ19853.1 MgtC/SapB family protein [Paenibacillus sp. JMULE4]
MSYVFLGKLGFSLLLGLLIGIDRQLKHKPLGMKTSMVISVASCLITIVSIESVHQYSVPGHTNMDPLRLAAQIVSGVGFIGAGVILRRNNDVISGLTTAAMVWAASALGIAAGAGFYLEAVTAVILIIMAINLFPMFIKLFGPQRLKERDVSVNIIVENNDEMTALIDELQCEEMRVKHIKVKDVDEEKQQIQMIMSAPNKQRTTSIYYRIKQLRHVVAVEVENISS